jgi:hypothetical protein
MEMGLVTGTMVPCLCGVLSTKRRSRASCVSQIRRLVCCCLSHRYKHHGSKSGSSIWLLVALVALKSYVRGSTSFMTTIVRV